MIRGDASDGLPGVRGIGEKGAAHIANHFQTIEEALEAAHAADERLTSNLCKKLIAGAEYIAIAPKIVHCALDVPIPPMSIAMPTRPANMEKIWQFKEDYGLGSSIDRMIAALNW